MTKRNNCTTDTQLKKALFIHPGAIGDCCLTLPLASMIKHKYGFDQIHFAGHTEYVSIYPGRTCFDSVRSVELLELHRLFNRPRDFDFDACRKLIAMLSEYEHVVSFLGSENDYFEENLNLALHCTHSADVTVMSLPEKKDEHICRFYQRQFCEKNLLELDMPDLTARWITPKTDDIQYGFDCFEKFNIREESRACLIHPGSGGQAKCWPLENFIRLADALTKDAVAPIFLLGPAEIDRFSPADLAFIGQHYPILSDLSLDDAVKVISATDCVIANDNGIGHLSGAMGKKTIVLFGPSSPTLYKPLGPCVKSISFEKEEFALISNQNQQHVCLEVMEFLHAKHNK